MDFVGAIKAGFKNYIQFRGTASRPEFWYWVLFTVLVGLVLSAIDVLGALAGAFSIATFLPSLSVTVRRLRDAGFSWVWLLLPAAGLVLLTVGIVQFVVELIGLGIDQAILDNPEQLDEQTLTALLANEALASSLGLIFLSGLFLFFASIVVQIIFPAQRSKSFEEGNKRVAPKGPEYPAI
jgi:uncharacterized membrane protein YhaH (DUF805 family)